MSEGHCFFFQKKFIDQFKDKKYQNEIISTIPDYQGMGSSGT